MTEQSGWGDPMREVEPPVGYWDADVTPYSAALHMIDLVRREEREYFRLGRADMAFTMRQLAQNMYAAAAQYKRLSTAEQNDAAQREFIRQS